MENGGESRIIDTFANVCKSASLPDMARRTKAEAERTKAHIVSAALACFERHGIAHATLEGIAAEAGVTKGAVYHHFASKREILHELRASVTLPFLDEADTQLLHDHSRPALERIENFLLGMLETLRNDARTRTALHVMSFKCEYAGDLEGELSGAVRKHRRLVKAFESAYAEARKAGSLRRGLAPRVAALETMLLMNGIVRFWLLDHGKEGIRRDAPAVIREHIRSRHA